MRWSSALGARPSEAREHDVEARRGRAPVLDVARREFCAVGGIDDDAHRVRRATAAARSVVVVFELMADGDDDDIAWAFDLEQRDVA